jgi:isopentenyl-diphosphate Delta-isomerase
MNLDKYKNRKVVLVDEQDNELGVGSLVEAHQGRGQKHRAFSLVLYRPTSSATSLGVNNVEILLQKRAQAKPVFPGLWANTCCYNLAPGEEYLSRAVSRVREEMGVEVDASVLQKLYQFSYYAPDPSTSSGQDLWCENELDQVIMGEWSGEVTPNPEEAEDYRWMGWNELKEDIKNNPEIYAPWWKMIVDDGKVEAKIYE